MEIQIEPHTLKRAIERGATEEEIKETILFGDTIEAKHGRLGKSHCFPFNKARNGKYYEHKRLEVFYVIENEIIITVTVYAFYGKW